MIALTILSVTSSATASAQEKPVVGLIPKVQKPLKLDGKLTDWDGAFVTPVHVGHPDFSNRGGQFLYLWDEKNLYIGLKCLDQKPAHVGKDTELYNGDAVEFYLDTRRGDKLGDAPFGPGTLHMFYTAFTGTDLKPRLQVRPLPAFKDFKLQGAEVFAAKTAWGYTAEFKLPWANFPDFAPKIGEIIGIEAGSLKPYGRVLLPLSLAKSTNYAWLYGTVCISPTIESSVAKLEGKLLDAGGKVRKSSNGNRKAQDGGFTLWTASWEMFDLPPGVYTVELTATDKAGGVITSRTEKVIHGNPALTK
jgi:hypothetical protein